MPRAPHRSLGELERGVLETLWTAARPLSVREVLEKLERKRPLAYTTVMTVLDRLHGKRLVRRSRDGRAFRYEASLSHAALVGEQAARVLIASHAPPARSVLMAFLDSAERASPELVQELEALIAERQRERRR